MDISPTTENWYDESLEFLGTKGIHLPDKLSQLRQKLYWKAKQESKYRFYSLFGLVLRLDVLETAWRISRKRNGSAGTDGVTFEMIENSEQGIEGFLVKLQAELRERTYRPSRVKRVYIPKSNGGQRPLGIPTIRDRVVQTAVLLLIEPIFEADFLDCSYGFRPKRSAKDALDGIKENINAGRTSIYDADLKSYFDTIPHDKLMACLQRRIADRTILRLIRMWLNSPIEDQDNRGKKRVHRPKEGTPQGGVISPLLANLFLHWFDKLFNGVEGPGQWANARIIRYADDFVIMAKYVGKRIVDFTESTIEDKFGLKINRDKTRVVEVSRIDGAVSFLGFTFRYVKDRLGRKQYYLNIEPSKNVLQRERDAISEMTSPNLCFKPVMEVIKELNAQVQGWGNYFSYGYPRKAFRVINWHACQRLTRHLNRRSQRPMRPPQGISYYKHLKNLGWVPL